MSGDRKLLFVKVKVEINDLNETIRPPVSLSIHSNEKPRLFI